MLAHSMGLSYSVLSDAIPENGEHGSSRRCCGQRTCVCFKIVNLTCLYIYVNMFYKSDGLMVD